MPQRPHQEHRHVFLALDGERLHLSPALAGLLRKVTGDRLPVDEIPRLTVRTVLQRGWFVRSRGFYTLTEKGRRVHRLLMDHDAKQS